MFKNMRLFIFFDMFLNPSFKMTTSFTNVTRTIASISNASFTLEGHMHSAYACAVTKILNSTHTYA